MPAVLTHDFFGRDVLDAFGQLDSATIDERDAFLIGNQGPDPLFFLALHPTLRPWRTLGSRMHKQRTNELVCALHRSLSVLDDAEAAVGVAYAQGFLGHFALDSNVHPLVYHTQYAICDAGIEGLSRDDGREVHAEIEREIDEMLLYRKRGQTIRDYPAADNTLDASPDVLATVQKMYAYVALSVFGEQVPTTLYPTAVECYRTTLAALHSPFGIKRLVASTAERTVRPHSFFGAMAYRTHAVEESWFANPDHDPWENPFTGEGSTASFDDLYQDALASMARAIELFDTGSLSEEDAREITRDVNFSGEPTVPRLTVEA